MNKEIARYVDTPAGGKYVTVENDGCCLSAYFIKL